MLDLTLLGCWGDLMIRAVTDHWMLGHYAGSEYLQRPSACLSHISDLVMEQSDRRALGSDSDINVLDGMWRCFFENESLLLEGKPYTEWPRKRMEENLGRAVFRSKMKEIGLSVACLHPTGPILPSTALLCRCPLKAPVPKSAVAQKLLFKNLVGLCYEQCRMRKLPFLGFILRWTAFPGETWTYPR